MTTPRSLAIILVALIGGCTCSVESSSSEVHVKKPEAKKPELPKRPPVTDGLELRDVITTFWQAGRADKGEQARAERDEGFAEAPARAKTLKGKRVRFKGLMRAVAGAPEQRVHVTTMRFIDVDGEPDAVFVFEGERDFEKLSDAVQGGSSITVTGTVEGDRPIAGRRNPEVRLVDAELESVN